MTRRTQLLALVVGLATAAALFLAPAAPAASPQARGPPALRRRAAVEQSGVHGIAWYVDAAAERVVVTADSTVSTAEVATIKSAAGADADAIQVERTTGVFSRCSSAGDAIYGEPVPLLARLQRGQGSTYYFLTAGHCGKVGEELVHQREPHAR